MVDSTKNILAIGDMQYHEYDDSETFEEAVTDALGNEVFAVGDPKGKAYFKGLKLGQQSAGDSDAVRKDELDTALADKMDKDVSNEAWGDYKLDNVGSVELTGSETDLVALYQFVDVAGAASGDDSTSNGYDLTMVNSPGVSSSPFSSAVELNGSDEYGRINSTLGITGYPFSMSAWVRTDSTSGLKMAVGFYSSSHGNYVHGFGVSNGRLYCRTGDGTTTDQIFTPFIGDGEWHHVAVVWSSSSDRKVYVDGNLAGESGTSVSFTQLDRFAVGAYYRPAVNYYWDGDIDEVSIWDKALSADEVKELHARRGNIDLYRGEVEQYMSRQTALSVLFPYLKTSSNIFPIPGITDDYKHLRQLIQSGTATISAGGGSSATFPYAFRTGTTPVVLTGTQDVVALVTPYTTTIQTVSNTSVSFRTWYLSGGSWVFAPAGDVVHWVAIGEID